MEYRSFLKQDVTIKYPASLALRIKDIQTWVLHEKTNSYIDYLLASNGSCTRLFKRS